MVAPCGEHASGTATVESGVGKLGDEPEEPVKDPARTDKGVPETSIPCGVGTHEYTWGLWVALCIAFMLCMLLGVRPAKLGVLAATVVKLLANLLICTVAGTTKGGSGGGSSVLVFCCPI